MLFTTPELTNQDLAALGEIEQYRSRLQYELRTPKRWTGYLRRNLMARAIRGSNSIEGYDVSLDDALDAGMSAANASGASMAKSRRPVSQ